MRKPKMTTGDFNKRFADIINKKRVATINKLLNYIAFKKGIKPDPLKITQNHERINNYSFKMLVFRYDGEVWLTEFPEGTSVTAGYRYESPFID